MKAAVLRSFSSPVTVESLAEPVLGTGEVIVEVAATPVLAYAAEILSGRRKYDLELPVVPGAGGVGRVRAKGPDATRLEIGDWVYVDATVRSRDDSLSPDLLLQGLTSDGTEGGRRLHRYFHDGTWAERVRVPTENVTRLGVIDPSQAAAWCSVSAWLVPYGGWLAGQLQAGETVVVNGATGVFGSAAVAVALALGAGAVVATGRNEAVLEELRRRFGERVRPVPMLGDEEQDRARILAAAPGPIDCVLDLLPPAATPTQVRAALLSVRPQGRVVLMGGVGMGGGPELELPYPWLMRHSISLRGQFMYPRHAPTRVIAMARAGLLSFTGRTITRFSLDRVEEAVAHATQAATPFSMTVLEPCA
jgi:alcohol dehydrogenase